MSIQPVGPEDEMRLWEWANEPGVRAMSFSSGPIPLAVHRRWFAARMNDPGCWLYLVCLATGPVGLVRFCRLDGGDWELGVSLDLAWRGHNLSVPAMALGCQRLMADTGATRVVARTRPQNEPFRRAAERLGFVERGACNVDGQVAILLTLDLS